MSASNKFGEGTISAKVVSVTCTSVPSKPLSIVLTIESYDSVSISWNRPADTGGGPVSGYIVLKGTTPDSLAIVSDEQSCSFTDSDVSSDVTTYYAVEAYNYRGMGPISDMVNITFRSGYPSAPRDLTAVGGDSGIMLSWTWPASDGNAGIIYYNIYRGTSPSSETTMQRPRMEVPSHMTILVLTMEPDIITRSQRWGRALK